MGKVYSNRLSEYTHENGGRVALLFLLFLIALYQLFTSGLTGFAVVCMLPVLAIFFLLALKYKMVTFWALFVINYFVMFLGRYNYMPLPASLPNEMFEIVLLFIAIINIKEFKNAHVSHAMTAAAAIWVVFCCLELFNDSCGIGYNFPVWFSGVRLMATQILYAVLVCSIYISEPDRIRKFIKVWAVLSLFAVFWAWKQKTIGFTDAEKSFLVYAARTHLVNGITRYFSVFTDAANFGCNMAASAVAFFIIGITSKLKRDRIFYIITGLCCTWGMFTSGTRTAVFCLIAGFMAYIFLSKSFKIAIPVIIIFGFFVAMLAFTKIGNGNNMIRRMRSAFNRNDASANARDINKETISKYLRDAPWGIGIGADYSTVPANSKFKKLSSIPPDSEYVYIWVHTGPIGLTVFMITTFAMLFGASWIVFFKLKSKSLRGIGAAFCCAFTAIQLGGYGNHILMQFPNVIIFYGGLSLVYLLPRIEAEYGEYEAELIAKDEERKRLKLEKKRGSRI